MATDPRRRGGCRAGKRAPRGGEPAGAPTPRGGGSPVAIPSQPPSRRVRRLRHSLPACSRPGWRASGRGLTTTPRVEGQPCPVVCLRTDDRKRCIGTRWQRRCRPAWCRMLTTAPARGASRPHAWRGRGHYAVAYSSPRRVSGSPHAVAAQRSASPDGACAGVAPGAMRWAHQPSARVLEAPALGVHGRMRRHTVAPGKTGTGRPSR